MKHKRLGKIIGQYIPESTCWVGNTYFIMGRYVYLMKILLPRPKAKEVAEKFKKDIKPLENRGWEHMHRKQLKRAIRTYMSGIGALALDPTRDCRHCLLTSRVKEAPGRPCVAL
jgi:hypothetical protein